jgi:hypothetical protein
LKQSQFSGVSAGTSVVVKPTSAADPTLQVSTKDELDALVALDVFKYDPEYNTHEKEYEVGLLQHWFVCLLAAKFIGSCASP